MLTTQYPPPPKKHTRMHTHTVLSPPEVETYEETEQEFQKRRGAQWNALVLAGQAHASAGSPPQAGRQEC